MANIEKHGTGYIYGLAVRLLPMLLPVLLLASCNGRGEHVALLDRADSLLSAGSYDEARRLTDSIGTGHLSRSEEMRRLLLLADISNQCYEPLPSDSIMQQVTDYYDAYGTPNEQMRAYYLRGYASADRGDSPSALDFYDKASSCADTLSRDCDFLLLMKVHSQKALLLENNLSPQLIADECLAASRFALKARDTLSAIICYEHSSAGYEMLGMADSALKIKKKAYDEYKKYGFESAAARCAGVIASSLVSDGRYSEAAPYMQEYESKSGFFDSNGDIESGKETYYYTKALYYIGIGDADSAERLLRQNLPKDDTNMLEAYYRGMSRVSQMRHQPDSVSKYSLLALEMSDRHFRETSSEQLLRMESLYNYEQHRRIAAEKSRQAAQARLVLLAIVALVVVFLICLYFWHRARQRHQELRFHQLEELHRIREEQISAAKDDLLRLRQQEYESAIESKQSELSALEHESESLRLQLDRQGSIISSYRLKRKAKDGSITVDEQLRQSPSYLLLSEFCTSPSASLPASVWQDLSQLFSEVHPHFRQSLVAACPSLSDSEYRICMLIRLGFKPGDIVNMTGNTSSNISNIRKRLLSRIFQKEGSVKDFDALIMKI